MKNIRKLEFEDIIRMVDFRMQLQNFDLKDIDENAVLIDEKELYENTYKYLKNNLNQNLFMFGYFVDNELIANCGFILERHFPTYNNPTGLTAYICNVFTLEDYRGRGFQKGLFEFALNFAKSMDIIKFELASKNAKAINMYESFGFIKKNNYYEYNIRV